jgi:hypothetical protein
MNARSSARRGVARHPVLAFMLISVDWLCDGGDPADCGLRDLAVRPAIARVFMSLGAAIAAFLVTAALSGQAGVTDLTRRSVRWRVPMRWYLIALLSVPVGATLISLVIYGPQALATPSVAGRERWPRSPPYLYCNWCYSNLPRRSDSPGSSKIAGRTGTMPACRACPLAHHSR